jgi:hypothetical protein
MRPQVSRRTSATEEETELVSAIEFPDESLDFPASSSGDSNRFRHRSNRSAATETTRTFAAATRNATTATPAKEEEEEGSSSSNDPTPPSDEQ